MGLVGAKIIHKDELCKKVNPEEIIMNVCTVNIKIYIGMGKISRVKYMWITAAHL